jgi:hypothetical protein
VQTASGDREFFASGCQAWVVAGRPQDQYNVGVQNPNPNHVSGAPASSHQISSDWDYRVGGVIWPNTPGDAQLGDHQLQNASCHWERLRDWSGDPGSIIASGDGPSGDGFSNFPSTFTVHHDEVGFQVSHCGFTPGGGCIYWYGTPIGAFRVNTPKLLDSWGR